MPLGLLWVLVPMTYLVLDFLLLAVAHARGPLTRIQNALVWLAPWTIAVALWTWVLSSISGSESGSNPFFTFGAGLSVATACFLIWRFVAFVVLHFASGTAEQVHAE